MIFSPTVMYPFTYQHTATNVIFIAPPPAPGPVLPIYQGLISDVVHDQYNIILEKKGGGGGLWACVGLLTTVEGIPWGLPCW